MDADTPKRILGLPKNIFFLGLTSLFNDFSSEMVYSVFPAFFIAVLRAGAESLGFVDGLAEAVSNIFKIYSGAFSDKFQRRKPLVVLGYVVSVLTRPFYALASTVGSVLGLRVTDRIGKGLRDAPRDAIISLSTPREELGRSFGYHRAMDTTGSILGPLVAYLILRSFPLHFAAVFWTAFFVGIIAVFSLLFISDVTLSSGALHRTLTSWGELAPSFRRYIAGIFILSIGALPVSVILLKTQSLGLTIADVPLFYMIYSISYAAFSMSAGKLSDRIGAKTIIVCGYLLLLASYFLLNFANTSWALGGSFFILGLFPAFTDGTQRSYASQLTAQEFRGGALGWLNAAIGFGALAAGIAGGYLWQTFGPATAFLTGGMLVVAGLIFLLSVSGSSSNGAAFTR